MTDLVERLREIACYDPDRPNLPTGPLAGALLEAADEIERLRLMVEALAEVRYR